MSAGLQLQAAVSNIVEEVLDGFSCTIFAYGQVCQGLCVSG